MIADILSNTKLNPIVTEAFKRKKIKHFSCFYHKISFCYTKSYETKFCTLLYYENPK